MALVVPNPTVPTNGQALDATPLLANLNAVYQAIQSFDGSQIQPGTVSAAALAAAINPNTLLKETEASFVYSGLIWTTVSGLAVTMTAGTAYIANATQQFRVSILSVASNTLLANKDVYIDVDVNGNITYNSVTNGATAPALTANAIRIAKIVTGAAAITSIVQIGADGIGNIIYPLGASSAKFAQNPVKFFAYANTTVSMTVSVWTKALVSVKVIDTGNNFDTVNNRFVAPFPGFYFLNAQVAVTQAGSGAGYQQGAMYKNGAPVVLSTQLPASGSNTAINRPNMNALLQLATGDYIEVFGMSTEGGRIIDAGQNLTFISGFLVSGA